MLARAGKGEKLSFASMCFLKAKPLAWPLPRRFHACRLFLTLNAPFDLKRTSDLRRELSPGRGHERRGRGGHWSDRIVARTLRTGLPGLVSAKQGKKDEKGIEVPVRGW